MRFLLLAALPLSVLAGHASATTVQPRAVPPDSVIASPPRIAPAVQVIPAAVRQAPAARTRASAVPVRAVVAVVRSVGLSAAVPPAAVASEGEGSTVEASVPAAAPVAAVREAVRIPAAPARPAQRSGRGDMDGDVRCVAQAVFHEARGETMQGQRAVADVVMNRARSGRWGGSACAVVNAPSQFSNRWSWRAPQIGVDAWDRAIAIARDAVSGAVGVSSRLMNFRAARLGGGGLRALRIGNHVFW